MRRAAVDVHVEIWPIVAAGFGEHGLRIVGSLDSKHEGVVRLIVESDAVLPAECDGALRLVGLTFSSEARGALTKISKVDVLALVEEKVRGK